MAKNRPLMLRLDPAQHELWVEAAERDGVRLSEWIRQTCDARLGAEEMNLVSDAELLKRVKKYTRPIEQAVERAQPAARKECPYARNHRPGAFCKFCFKSY